ncbi:MAG: hypothetical protein CL489_14705 [Acidobacteria bacterium]|nr:hypothetical protein [Acidobacteriota bacterium]
MMRNANHAVILPGHGAIIMVDKLVECGDLGQQDNEVHVLLGMVIIVILILLVLQLVIIVIIMVQIHVVHTVIVI